MAQDPEPTVLLLDEPTNNLDTEGLDWLEDFVKRFKGAILFVSHDRRFINAVATKVVELKDGVTRQYGGNYDFYKEQKDIELQAALEKYENSKKKRSDSRKRWSRRKKLPNMFMSTLSVRIMTSTSVTSFEIEFR